MIFTYRRPQKKMITKDEFLEYLLPKTGREGFRLEISCYGNQTNESSAIDRPDGTIVLYHTTKRNACQ